jgi:voltage-gated potassium channel Kch
MHVGEQRHARSRWRSRLRRYWRDTRWAVIAGLWVFAVCLGVIAFKNYQDYHPDKYSYSFWSWLYLSLQLFPLQSGLVEEPVGTDLQIARLLAPGVAAFTLLEAVLAIFSEQLRWLRVRFMKGHIVISGLGREGFLLASMLVGRGDQVVAIEQDRARSAVDEAREMGVTVLLGSATDRELLRKAGAQRARYVVTVSGDDGINAEVAAHVQELAEYDRRSALTSVVEISNLELSYLLRAQALMTEKPVGFKRDFFNLFENGAQALLADFPPFPLMDAGQGSRPHVLVVGLGRLGESLIMLVAKAWWLRPAANGERLSVTVVDPEAEGKIEALRLRYRHLEQACNLVVRSTDIRSADFQRAEFLIASDGRPAVSSIYICLDDDSTGLAAALVLLPHARVLDVSLVVCMTHEAGLATLLPAIGKQVDGFKHLCTFEFLNRACTPDSMLGGANEVLARAMHASYVQNEAEKGETPETNTSMVAWEALPDDLKDSNRDQAAHVSLKLRAVNCTLAPLTDWDAVRFEFRPDELEVLAQMEHKRWVEERRAAGWRWAPGPRDTPRKTTPYLVPWDELAEDVKEKDRNAVRGLPVFLARAGLKICRRNE